MVHVRQGEQAATCSWLQPRLRVALRPQVPVLVVDGEQLNDSSFIIKALSAKLDPGRGKGKAGKLTGQAAADEEEWFRQALQSSVSFHAVARQLTRVLCHRSWVDGRFVHVLTPNIYRTLSEALQTFDYITKTGNFGFVDREVARWSGVGIMVRHSAARRLRLRVSCR